VADKCDRKIGPFDCCSVDTRRGTSAKLNEESVRKIRALLAEGRTLVSIGNEFGVGWGAIRLIREGQTWNGVDNGN
jgi:hypothetical protein